MTRYWFRPKRYGYGATPVTWEGWAVTFLCAAVVAGSIVTMQLTVGRTNFVAWMVWAAIIAGVVFRFIRLSQDRTDGEWRWRWGEEPDGRKR